MLASVMAIMAETNNANDQSLLWGYPIEVWDSWGVRALIWGAVIGVFALLLTAASAYILYRVADVAQKSLESESKASSERVATLNKDTVSLQTDLAKAQVEIAEAREAAAKAQLALQKYKGPRNLDIEPFLAKLATASAAKVQVVYVRECTDCSWLAQFIASFLVTAKWESWLAPIDEVVAVANGPFRHQPSAISLRARPWGITILAKSIDDFGKEGTSLEALFQALLPSAGGNDMTVTNDPELPADIIRIVVAPKG